ncbi:MAG TPA: hypothetical protein PKV66_03425 [Candidatus Pelethenecus sp.]|nr:hypothetical protein [Candidatus Pelethenecus sp.]
MWIKTQDGTTLVNCDDFTITKRKKKPGYIVSAGRAESNTGYIAGLYSSKEKALKVLQMIEEHIFNKERVNSRKPFQFPINEDVKE